MRQEGFYWVQLEDMLYVAYWDSDQDVWWLDNAPYDDKFIRVRSERLEEPKDET